MAAKEKVVLSDGAGPVHAEVSEVSVPSEPAPSGPVQGGRSLAGTVLRLQQAAGNRAVAALIGGRQRLDRAEDDAAATPASAGAAAEPASQGKSDLTLSLAGVGEFDVVSFTVGGSDAKTWNVTVSGTGNVDRLMKAASSGETLASAVITAKQGRYALNEVTVTSATTGTGDRFEVTVGLEGSSVKSAPDGSESSSAGGGAESAPAP